MKAIIIYIAMLASATGLYHAVNHLQIAADAPILAIAQQQQRNGFDAQWTPATPAQGAAAVAAYRAQIAADQAAVDKAEHQEMTP
jgi:disulfide bond formation protein DsbB